MGAYKRKYEEILDEFDEACRKAIKELNEIRAPHPHQDLSDILDEALYDN